MTQVLEVLNSNWWPVGGYVTAAALALNAARREQRAVRERLSPDLWPPFWMLTTVLFLAMAVGHAGDLGTLVSDFGRRGARSDGWYESRRSLQSIAVGTVGALWLAVTLVAVWRFPERRRRYLPMAIIVFSLMCFAAIRVVSLHQVDALLYRRQFAGVRLGVVTELSSLVLAAAMTFWQPASRPGDPAATENPVASIGRP